MTIILVTTLADALGGAIPADAALIATSSRVRTAGETLTAPREVKVTFRDGEPTEPIELDAPDVATYWNLRLEFPHLDRPVIRNVQFPNVPSIEWADLTDIDPATMKPDISLIPVWESLTAEMQRVAATAAASVAVSEAARDVAVEAAEAAAAVPAQVSTAMSEVLSDPEDPFTTELSAKIAEQVGTAAVGPEVFGALSPLKATLAGGKSGGFQNTGDSTGNESWEYARLFHADLLADHPEYTGWVLDWDDVTQSLIRETLQTGTAGVQYLDADGAKIRRGSPSVYLGGVVDVRLKLRAPDWTPGTARMIAGQFGAPGSRSWAVALSTTGRPVFVYSIDGTALGTYTCNADPVGLVDGADTWLRWVFTPDNGSSKSTIAFYQSTDGETWTQIGTTLTDPVARVLFNAASPDPLSGFMIGGETVGAYGRWVGRIYEIEFRDGLNGPNVVPVLPELWPRTQVSSAPVVGAPVLTLVNGSFPGATLAYLGDAERVKIMTPDYGQRVIMINEAHNEAHRTGSTFTNLYGAWLEKIAARLPDVPFLLLTQNPQTPASSWPAEQGQRRSDLLAYGAANKLGVVDTYGAFLAYGDWEADLMADMVHPNEAGQMLWKAQIADAYARA